MDIEREIIELHEFFEHWFRGELPDDDESFSRFADVMAADFVLVRPEGTESTRADLMHSLRTAHGCDPGAAIQVTGIRRVADSGELLVARYEEIQETADGATRRLSTVIFRRREGAPNGLAWVRVHETWSESS